MKVQSEVIQNFRFNYDGQSLSALTTKSRRSRQEVFCENSTFKNFEKFTGKVSFNKAAELQLATFRQRCFPVNFTKFLGTPFIEHLCVLFMKNRWSKCIFFI